MKLESIFDQRETRKLEEEELRKITIYAKNQMSNKKTKASLATTGVNFSKRSKSNAVDFNKTLGTLGTTAQGPNNNKWLQTQGSTIAPDQTQQSGTRRPFDIESANDMASNEDDHITDPLIKVALQDYRTRTHVD